MTTLSRLYKPRQINNLKAFHFDSWWRTKQLAHAEIKSIKESYGKCDIKIKKCKTGGWDVYVKEK